MCPITTDLSRADPKITDHSGGRLTIDLDAIADNWRMLAKLASHEDGSGACAGVVKGNAYGLGLEPVSKALWNAGCRTFFVALPQEAFELRGYLSEAAIYCLGGLTPGGAKDFTTCDVRPVLNTMEEVQEWASTGSQHLAALHVDTGMTRLGLALEETEALASNKALMGQLHLSHVMSHLACADTPDHPLNDQQIENFARVRALFPDIAGSLANSPGTLQDARFRHDLARPGIAIYGGQSMVPAPIKLNPVIRLEARVMQIRSAKAGAAVGYGAARTLDRDSRIAVLGVGYADGYHRLVGNTDDTETLRPHVRFNGRAAPLVGRVSMDLIAVDVTEPDFDDLRPGMFVTMIDETITVDVVAGWANTIGYEVLTGLGQRYARTYVGS
ncbi:MAG: alanine racemase [Pseudomonadota bacterium]